MPPRPKATSPASSSKAGHDGQLRPTAPLVPPQKALQLPLLKALQDAGGQSSPQTIYQRLASTMRMPPQDVTEARVYGGKRRYNVFQQQVRWARQTAVMQGLISADTRGLWKLTQAGHAALGKIRRSAVVLVYSLTDGLALWGHAEDAASAIEPGSLSLVMLSPPYPGVRREYGSIDVPEWLDWMSRLTLLWKDLIQDNGTIAINLMDRFEPGSPSLSPYIERYTLSAIDNAGLHLAGRTIWHSPTKLGNIQWTAKERVQPKNTIEHILLFSKTTRPDWDTRRLPQIPYAPRTASQLRSDEKRKAAKRPSGYDLNPSAFQRNGNGSIPGNLIVAAGASGSETYSRRCKAAGLSTHPARYPLAVPRHIIGLTTAAGDTVYDPMAGSNTTGQVALEI